MLFNASDSGPRNASSLPASGAALTANTIYVDGSRKLVG